MKDPTLGKHSVTKKNEDINARLYWTNDTTENVVTECLLKEQTFFCVRHACFYVKLNRQDWMLDPTVKNMPNGRIQLLQTWLMVGCKCNIHGCSSDETLTDMHADSKQIIKTWLLVRCKCNTCLMVLCNSLDQPVGWVRILGHNWGSEANITDIPSGSAPQQQMCLAVSCNWFKGCKGAKIRNRYNQVPQLIQDTNGKVTNSQLDTTNESQEISPFPAGNHKAYKQTLTKA